MTNIFKQNKWNTNKHTFSSIYAIWFQTWSLNRNASVMYTLSVSWVLYHIIGIFVIWSRNCAVEYPFRDMIYSSVSSLSPGPYWSSSITNQGCWKTWSSGYPLRYFIISRVLLYMYQISVYCNWKQDKVHINCTDDHIDLVGVHVCVLVAFTVQV